MIGETIGRIKILSELGRGGMGVVYLGEHTKLGKLFAVKILSQELTQDPSFRERFMQEGRNQALLTHPNIVQVTDFIEMDGRFFLVMEYVDGQSLDAIIKSHGNLSDEEALPIVKDVLDGLSFAHDKGIVHRDMKPSNILIDSSGRAKIMDFGIAVLAGEERLTATGTNVGSPWYMSPEQISTPKTIDHRCDLYSVGIVMYEVLTGDVPFKGDTDFSIMNQHINAPVPDPTEKNPAIASRLAGIVLRALEKEPAQRFQDCLDFITAIEGYQTETQLPKHTVGRSRKPSRLRRALPYIGGVLALAVAMLSASVWLTSGDTDVVVAKPPTPDAIDPVTRPEGTSLGFQINYVYKGREGDLKPITNSTEVYSGDEYKIIFTPDQDAYVYIFQADSRGRLFNLFPMQEFQGLVLGNVNPVPKGQKVTLPGPNKTFWFDEQTGVERFYFLAGHARNDGLESLASSLERGLQTEKNLLWLETQFESRKVQETLTENAIEITWSADSGILFLRERRIHDLCARCVYVTEFSHQ